MGQTFAFKTLAQSTVAEFKDRGSRFVGLAHPVEEESQVKILLQQAKADFPKANHYCFAWRLGTDGNRFRSSDDGEPAGSAGKPILGQIDSKEITNTLVLVVRYFGGTLLGVPGLINAYKTTAALALQLSPLIQVPVLVVYELQFDYTRMNAVMTLLKRFNAIVKSQEQSLFTVMVVGLPLQHEASILHNFKELPFVHFRKC